MKRRRYSPSAEGLEPRELLAGSIFNPSNPFGSFDPTPVLPNTIEEKAERIERLPVYMEQFQQNRVIPANVMTNIQNDLRAVVTKLVLPRPAALTQYNHEIRAVLPDTSLSPASEKGLINEFSLVLANAHATVPEIASFQTDLTALGKVDVASANPAILATNDITLILQIALSVGQPPARPKVPVLLAADQIRKNSHITTVSQPTLTGTYDPGALLQLVDNRGDVLGTTVVDNTGQYSVKFTQPAAPGVYVLAVRAYDNGVLSDPSPIVRIKVVAPKAPAK